MTVASDLGSAFSCLHANASKPYAISMMALTPDLRPLVNPGLLNMHTTAATIGT